MISILTWSGMLAAIWLALFQGLLAAGAPLGFLAWGGEHPGRLPPTYRAASLASAGLAAVFASAFAQRAELIDILPDQALFWVFLAGAALFGLSTIANLASASRPERRHGVPLAAVLTLSSAALAVL